MQQPWWTRQSGQMCGLPCRGRDALASLCVYRWAPRATIAQGLRARVLSVGENASQGAPRLPAPPGVAGRTSLPSSPALLLTDTRGALSLPGGRLHRAQCSVGAAAPCRSTGRVTRGRHLLAPFPQGQAEGFAHINTSFL